MPSLYAFEDADSSACVAVGSSFAAAATVSVELNGAGSLACLDSPDSIRASSLCWVSVSWLGTETQAKHTQPIKLGNSMNRGKERNWLMNGIFCDLTLNFPDLFCSSLAPYTDIIGRALSSSVFSAQPCAVFTLDVTFSPMPLHFIFEPTYV